MSYLLKQTNKNAAHNAFSNFVFGVSAVAPHYSLFAEAWCATLQEVYDLSAATFLSIQCVIFLFKALDRVDDKRDLLKSALERGLIRFENGYLIDNLLFPFIDLAAKCSVLNKKKTVLKHNGYYGA